MTRHRARPRAAGQVGRRDRHGGRRTVRAEPIAHLLGAAERDQDRRVHRHAGASDRSHTARPGRFGRPRRTSARGAGRSMAARHNPRRITNGNRSACASAALCQSTTPERRTPRRPRGPRTGPRPPSAARPDARLRRVVGAVRRPDEAARHRAAARHDGADDDPRGGRLARPRAGRSRRSSAATLAAGVGQRAQLLPRPRHRRGHEPHQAASARHGRGVAARGAGVRPRCSASLSLAWLALLVNPASAWLTRGRDRDLRRRLHDDPQAPHAAEHRVGRHRRLHAGAHRLVRGHRRRCRWTARRCCSA